MLYSGFCKSGLTIKDATQSVLKLTKKDRTCIVYLGSTDIIKGHFFADLQNDFHEFINACRVNRFFPILCTLAPIPTHQLGTRQTVLLDFNKFLEAVAREYHLPLIDIYKCFVKPNGSFEENCYAAAPRAVSGMKEWIAPWSLMGRKKFQDMIKKNIGCALIAQGFVKLDTV